VIPRRFFAAAALLCGVVAGLAYYLDARRVSVLVASRPIPSEAILAADDLRRVEVPLEVAPRDVVVSESEAVGRPIHAPLAPGQFVVTTLFEGAPGFRAAMPTAAGWRAVALPVSAATALGGAIAPGIRVDVVSVPIADRSPPGRAVERVATGVSVLDVRSDTGGPFAEPGAENGPLSNSRLGSVIVAVPAADEIRFAELIATSTLVLFRSP
jgi:Flp pilus assembly protein CpaB